MKKVLGIVGSNYSRSVNRKLLEYVGNQLDDVEFSTKLWDDFDIPFFNQDLIDENRFPIEISILNNKIADADALVIAVSEYNYSISAFFKNILDWLSALDPHFMTYKKILLMSTSNDENGSAHALAYMEKILPHFGAVEIQSFSLPNFKEIYDEEEQRLNNEVVFLGLKDMLIDFEQSIHS